MQTYTVLDRNGNVRDQQLTAEAAAKIIMQYDGHDYEVRRSDDGQWLDLWITKFSRNSTLGGRPMVKSVHFGTTEADIWANVITHADHWNDQQCMTDEDYAVFAAIVD